MGLVLGLQLNRRIIIGDGDDGGDIRIKAMAFYPGREGREKDTSRLTVLISEPAGEKIRTIGVGDTIVLGPATATFIGVSSGNTGENYRFDFNAPEGLPINREGLFHNKANDEYQRLNDGAKLMLGRIRGGISDKPTLIASCQQGDETRSAAQLENLFDKLKESRLIEEKDSVLSLSPKGRGALEILLSGTYFFSQLYPMGNLRPPTPGFVAPFAR